MGDITRFGAGGKACAALLLSLLLGACATQPEARIEAATQATAAAKPAPAASDEDNDANAQLVLRSLSLIQAKKPAEALPLARQAVAEYEKRYRESGVISYSSRSFVETIAYLGQAASANTPAKVHGPWFGLAYFTQSFALVDLHRNPEARQAFDAAIPLSPQNSKYLSERGNIDALEKNWRASFDRFKQALDAAQLSPEQVKTSETTRARAAWPLPRSSSAISMPPRRCTSAPWHWTPPTRCRAANCATSSA